MLRLNISSRSRYTVSSGDRRAPFLLDSVPLIPVVSRHLVAILRAPRLPCALELSRYDDIILCALGHVVCWCWSGS
ncbi:hypothetical protein BDW71DRAFT_187804 [Aspergillus fruticulosus]